MKLKVALHLLYTRLTPALHPLYTCSTPALHLLGTCFPPALRLVYTWFTPIRGPAQLGRVAAVLALLGPELDALPPGELARARAGLSVLPILPTSDGIDQCLTGV